MSASWDNDLTALSSLPPSRLPPSPAATATVLVTDMRLDRSYACAIFDSCKGTGTAQSASLGICEQFLNFLGGTNAIPLGSLTNYLYSEPENDTELYNPDSLWQPWYSCCSFPANISKTIPAGVDPSSNTSCPCATCTGACGTTPCFGNVTVPSLSEALETGKQAHMACRAREQQQQQQASSSSSSAAVMIADAVSSLLQSAKDSLLFAASASSPSPSPSDPASGSSSLGSISQYGPMYGLPWQIIIIVYTTFAAFTVLVMLSKRCCPRQMAACISICCCGCFCEGEPGAGAEEESGGAEGSEKLLTAGSASYVAPIIPSAPSHAPMSPGITLLDHRLVAAQMQAGGSRGGMPVASPPPGKGLAEAGDGLAPARNFFSSYDDRAFYGAADKQ